MLLSNLVSVAISQHIGCVSILVPCPDLPEEKDLVLANLGGLQPRDVGVEIWVIGEPFNSPVLKVSPSSVECVITTLFFGAFRNYFLKIKVRLDKANVSWGVKSIAGVSVVEGRLLSNKKYSVPIRHFFETWGTKLSVNVVVIRPLVERMLLSRNLFVLIIYLTSWALGSVRVKSLKRVYGLHPPVIPTHRPKVDSPWVVISNIESCESTILGQQKAISKRMTTGLALDAVSIWYPGEII